MVVHWLHALIMLCCWDLLERSHLHIGKMRPNMSAHLWKLEMNTFLP